jgi:hypothetical protein
VARVSGVGGTGGSSSRDEHGQREGSSGRWVIGIRDNNFLWVCSDGSSRIRSLIGIKRGVRWRDYSGLRHPDIVSIEVLPDTGPAVRIFNVYNRNTLRSVNLLDELHHAECSIVAGDMNAHHLRWSRADREPSEDWRDVLPIVIAGTLAIEPGTITRIGILRLLILFLTSLAWRCENLFAHQSSPSPSHSPHHCPFTPVEPGYGDD